MLLLGETVAKGPCAGLDGRLTVGQTHNTLPNTHTQCTRHV